MKFKDQLRCLFWLLQKDVKLKWRSKRNLCGLFLFAASVALLFSVSTLAKPGLGQSFYPLALQISMLFASVLSTGRAFEAETALDAQTAVLMTALPFWTVLLSKILVQTLECSLVALFLAFLLSLGLHVPLHWGAMGLQSVQILLCTLGLSALAVPLRFLSIQSRLAESFLPVIVFPLSAPLLIAGSAATYAILNFESAVSAFLFMLCFDLVMIGFNLFFLESLGEE